MKRNLITIKLTLCLLGVSVLSHAQDLPAGFKTWVNAGVNWRFTKKASLNFSQIIAINTKPSQLQFTQSNLRLNR